jgi:hypothetical protein
MSVIHLPDAARFSVAEAKLLLSDAFPREDVMDVYINADGVYHCERQTNGNPKAFYLEHDFAETCEQLGIKPRFRLRPLLTGYRGPQDDELYVITRDELAALAEFFGIAASTRDPVPALEQAPQAAEVTPPAPAKDGPKTWKSLAWLYMVAKLKAGNFATAKALDGNLLATTNEVDSPFERGQGPENRGSLVLRATGKKLDLKTIQNNWQALREAATLT